VADRAGGAGALAPEPSGNGRRRVVYCLIPTDLAETLHDPLRRHFRDDPGVEVIVEHRRADRRSAEDRRQAEGDPPSGEERRKIRAIAGRRIADLRASMAPIAEPPPLPRRARRHAEEIVFFERLEPSTQEAEDRDTAALVARFQAGEQDAFADLYSRYFDRVYGYLRVALRDAHEAEDLAQQVFMKVLEALPRYERRRQPFRAWLFVLVRNQGISHLRKSNRLEVEDPAVLERRRETIDDTPARGVLDWISDRDVMIFVERLPLQPRQALVMRYLLDMNSIEIAEVLGTSPDQVRAMQRRALLYLRERLAAVREPKRVRPTPIRRWRKQDIVLRRRRFALIRH
jgi:RNA polymerase sigma-70 factor (ECF subfamily)